jgi:asparagine synthetase B (glutamine-hydrolysing)
MCGVFGVLGAEQKLALRKFEKLAQISSRRGQDSFGAFAVANRIKVVPVLKGCGSAVSVIKSDAYLTFKQAVDAVPADIVSLVGHTRLATNGDWSVLENNQPAVMGGLITVHNGIITNESELKTKYLPSDFAAKELDTFGYLGLVDSQISTAGELDLGSFNRIVDEKVEGANNFVTYMLGSDVITFYSNNGSLYLAKGSDDVWCFASERAFLTAFLDVADDKIHQLNAGKAALWSLEKNELVFFDHYSDRKISIKIDKKSESKFRLIQSKESENYKRTSAVSELAKVMDGEYQRVLAEVGKLRRCQKCLLPESFPGIHITQKSCSVCDTYVPQKVVNDLESLDRRLGSANSSVLVSLSGGRDSSYTLHLMSKELKRKVTAFTYDWGMVTDLARRNQSRMCGQLDVEHIIVAADIRRKRSNIRKNVSAWLKRPSLGTIPLFMAGDKHYFYWAEKIKRELSYSNLVMGENKLEKTGFKTRFAGAEQTGSQSNMAYNLSALGKLKMLEFYGRQFAINPGYWNSSLLDTFKGFLSYYALPHRYINVFNFVNWEEQLVDSTLRQYDWEYSADCATSWRIGDGTAPFYNYIYYVVAGFSENDTLRANQIREGQISLEHAKNLIERDNRPRAESFSWYCEVLGLDAVKIARSINQIPKQYPAS